MNSAHLDPLPSETGYDIQGGEFHGKSLRIGASDRIDSIRDNARFVDCGLVIERATRQSFDFEASFIRCAIHSKRPLRNARFHRTTFLACQFSGRYIGCEFGPKLEGQKGSISDCTFRDTHLHLTKFFGSSLEGFDLPDWPHIYLIESARGVWRDELHHDSLPQVLRVLAKLERSSKVNPISTLALHLPDAGIDPELLWPLIQSAPSVWFPSKSAKARGSELAVSNALMHFSDQSTESDRRRERENVFHLLHRSWLKGSRVVGDAVDLNFDTTFLRSRVADAPTEIHVRLSSGSAEHVTGDTSSPIGSTIDRFMVMGVATDGEYILLKPHRKERGFIRLRFDSFELLRETGAPLSVDQLLAYVQQSLHHQ